MNRLYVKFQTTFWTHPKALNAMRMLGVDAIRFGGMMARLWSFARDNTRNGDLAPWGEAYLASLLLWGGSPADLFKALRECGVDGKAGFLTGMMIHDWKDVTEEPGKRRRNLGEQEDLPLPTEDPTDYEGIRQAWNKRAEALGLPAVREVTRSRKVKIRARNLTAETIEKVLEAAAKQPFLSGASQGGWRMDFDWLIRNDENATKVLELKYASSRGGQAQKDEYAGLRGKPS